ncbi:MAG: UDP-N-acetylmuramoyl-tripeptide--D-alanyl-D-alanine ligase [Armatimonadetes bacterium]|nr:UDP-N-acetylmuramoyl-tripeptide--D-alanyl-D-alanine ligase [Armatimonadota bacterium]
MSRSWSCEDFATRCGGRLLGAPDVFAGFSHDSRNVVPGSAYLAIAGANVDGHSFAPSVIAQGAAVVIGEREIPGLPMIIVANLVEALAKFASTVRSEFSGPVLGVTGSNGKTSTKEFAAAALSPLGPVLKNEGNRNTEYTAPLIWAELVPETKSVVSEMAMRGFKQISHLARFTRPTCALITMIGTSHAEMVGSREGIMRAKAEIFEGLTPGAPALLWREDDFYSDLAARAPGPVRTFGFTSDAECQVVGYRALDWGRSVCMLSLQGQNFEIEVPTVGRHQALNIAAAMLAADSCGVDLSEAAEAIPGTKLPAMRMETFRIGSAIVLLDNYNASPDSTVAALKTLQELPTTGKKLAVIGEMKELGDFSESGHRLVGKALAGSHFDGVMLYGEHGGCERLPWWTW